MKKAWFFFSMALAAVFSLPAQNTSYWQQHVDYTMDVEMDVKNISIYGYAKTDIYQQLSRCIESGVLSFIF